jgi:hypothetical protein
MSKKSKKKDTGFIRSLGVSEETRDRLAKRDWSKPPERKKTPADMTTAELKDLLFSGVRINKFTAMTELWVAGHIRAEAKTVDVQRDPTVFAEMHERVFKTTGTLVETNGDKDVNKLDS